MRAKELITITASIKIEAAQFVGPNRVATIKPGENVQIGFLTDGGPLIIAIAYGAPDHRSAPAPDVNIMISNRRVEE